MPTIIGHDRHRSYFEKAVKDGSLSHAYLFSGPEMIGKRSFAIELYQLLNGRKATDQDPDLLLVNKQGGTGGNEIEIGQIRGLRRWIHLKPYLGPFKVAVIDDAHELNSESANALLKTLEEPPARSILILVTALPGLLPRTIRSRCQNMRFNIPDSSVLESYLETKDLSPEENEFLKKISYGRIGFIENMIEGKHVDEAKKAVDDLRGLVKKKIFDRFQYAKKIYEGETYSVLVNYWFDWLYASVIESPKAQEMIPNILKLKQTLSRPEYNHRLAIENFLINL